eukprot:4913974-Amphidinium_carterae.1
MFSFWGALGAVVVVQFLVPSKSAWLEDVREAMMLLGLQAGYRESNSDHQYHSKQKKTQSSKSIGRHENTGKMSKAVYTK